MRSDERVEELMDAALRSYAEGVEVPDTRVSLARVMVRAREIEGRRRIWAWAAAACLVVMASVGAAWMVGEPRVAEIAWLPMVPGVPGILPGVSTVGSHPFMTNGASGKGGAPSVRLALEPASAHRLPKLEVFPAPRALTAEERALVVFATQGSPAAKNEVIEAEKHLGDPITISDLRIEPLEDKSRE